jgi:lysylphosphatidylglycerol synthetase-like protein (DUF2156 family)
MERIVTAILFVALVVIVVPTISIGLGLPEWLMWAVMLAALVLTASSHLVDLLVRATTPDDEDGAR